MWATWRPASEVYFIHLAIEDELSDVEVVFSSSYLCKIVVGLVIEKDMDNADFVSILNLLPGRCFEVMVTMGPWNNPFNHFELLLVKLFVSSGN
ncbi:unnamed protein product [Linum trigynum]|uniref:Uncharacterized protein n=1 Tax=Linum trigynum TaxID=586398 RepID=A0AAV2GMZ0_9ROSI